VNYEHEVTAKQNQAHTGGNPNQHMVSARPGGLIVCRKSAQTMKNKGKQNEKGRIVKRKSMY
jgi:hypothetical protein